MASLRLLLGLALTLAAPARTVAAPVGGEVFVVDDEVRLRRSDSALARTRGPRVSEEGSAPVEVVALRGETVAFQVVVVAGAADIAETTLTIAPFAPADATRPLARPLSAEIFREHYLHVDRRSRNDSRPAESLGWTPVARPSDERMRGEVPDALIPVAIDATPVAPRPAVPAQQTGTFWVDLYVPQDTAPGILTADAVVGGDGATLARFRVRLTVRDAVLPFRATGAFVYYEAERLDRRVGDGPAVERQLWQLMHAHHLDALAPLSQPEDVARLASAYDGSLFSEAAGYRGPGAGVPPSVVALGSYGILGDPSADALARVDAMAAALPAAIEDVFLYAIDEQCQSPRAAAWKAALAGRAAGQRVRVGHTCDEPPERQSADIALLPGHAFPRAAPTNARAVGKKAWIYNGALPRTGTLMLDADPRGLTVDGWIAAAFGIERWFYWESIFWDDDNKGGRGPVDPFVTTETFHNTDGDTALGDGLLLYPGRPLGVKAVLPSLRLKALRRGIQDAALIALAMRDAPDQTRRIVLSMVPAALDEVSPTREAFWELDGATFPSTRGTLRTLVRTAAPLSRAEARAAFDALAAARTTAVPLAPAPRSRRQAGAVALVGAILAVGVLFTTAAMRRRRSARRADPRDPTAARTRRS